jgi:hypothetical protein
MVLPTMSCILLLVGLFMSASVLPLETLPCETLAKRGGVQCSTYPPSRSRDVHALRPMPVVYSTFAWLSVTDLNLA